MDEKETLSKNLSIAGPFITNPRFPSGVPQTLAGRQAAFLGGVEGGVLALSVSVETPPIQTNEIFSSQSDTLRRPCFRNGHSHTGGPSYRSGRDKGAPSPSAISTASQSERELPGSPSTKSFPSAPVVLGGLRWFAFPALAPPRPPLEALAASFLDIPLP